MLGAAGELPSNSISGISRVERASMKSLAHVICSLATVLIAASASAAVTPEEADHLGKDLTAFGAEKAGNANGTIPAWEGGDTQLPGWERGKGRQGYATV